MILPVAKPSFIKLLMSFCCEEAHKEEYKKEHEEEDEETVNPMTELLIAHSLKYKCHPIIYLAILMCEQGLSTSNGYVSIIGTNFYSSHNFGDFFQDYSDYVILENRFIKELRIDLEVASEILLGLNKKLIEGNSSSLSLETRYKWEKIFDKLNFEITLANLRILSQALSNFVRSKKIELCGE